MKRYAKLQIKNLPARKRLGPYDFEGFPKNAVLLEVGTGKLWLNDNGLHGNNHYDLREIHNGAVEVQSGAYVYYPSRRWVHEHFDMVGIATLEQEVTLAQGPGRKLAEADPLYSNATKELRKAGDLKVGETARWSDAAGNNFVARRA